jgi:hypothetical protein
MPARKNRKAFMQLDWAPLRWLTVALTIGLIVGVSAVTIQWKSGYFSGQTVTLRTAP